MEPKAKDTTLRARAVGKTNADEQLPRATEVEDYGDDQEYILAVIRWLVVGLLVFVAVVTLLASLGFKVKPSTL
jgi:hypothetical protein